ncbi:MAG: DUF5667 domain-containing protein, partial [Bacteroidales bacterium]|nr:DUF5667 domain-containing protein [Bacteroidales bacterium]
MCKTKILVGIALFASFLAVSPVFAQTDEMTVGEVTATVEDVVIVPTAEVVTIEETVISNVEIPSSWGLFWQNFKEQISLAFTFDPVKKAEKLTAFSQQRMEMAQSFADQVKDNPVFQKKAEQMM